jgi:lipopolysaccharide/colanic/teichoic acid biosynthesis glycosyltransferase
MQLIVMRDYSDCSSQSGNLLRFAMCDPVISSVILAGWDESFSRPGKLPGRYSPDSVTADSIVFALPQSWQIKPDSLKSAARLLQNLRFEPARDIISYNQYVTVPVNLRDDTPKSSNASQWLVVSNGRFAAHTGDALSEKFLSEINADVISVNVQSDLMSNAAKIRLTTEGKIAGFRRLYSDTAEPTPLPADWPCHLFIRLNVLDKLLDNRVLPGSFDAFVERCRLNALTIKAVNAGGVVFDLENTQAMLDFCRKLLCKIGNECLAVSNKEGTNRDTEFIGTVLLGDNVKMAPEVVVAGPAIIGNNVRIERGAVINSSIIGSDSCVANNQFVNNCIISSSQARPAAGNSSRINLSAEPATAYRDFPALSYAGTFKRIFDILFSSVVIILCVPLVPFIALVIKLTSPGPVFFKDNRQGLHGKKFNCLKFRTMITGADKIQEKLRFVSHVDGPQFKIVNDPRINAVGKFLRNTYIDELPQFLNVLLGQMSVIGPRPSPESENTTCPFWRDARLSVRPGITGLWQISRTRQPMRDFQEWIRYDTQYVKNLSLKMDLGICWKTISKLANDFINQF